MAASCWYVGSESTWVNLTSCHGFPAADSSFLRCLCSFCDSLISWRALRNNSSTHLYSRLLRCGLIVASGPDPFRNFLPQFSTLPITLLINRLHRDLLLRRTRIKKDCAFAASSCGNTRPLSLIRLDAVRAAAYDRFERVGFAGEVAFALVVDLHRSVESDIEGKADYSSGVAGTTLNHARIC